MLAQMWQGPRIFWGLSLFVGMEPCPLALCGGVWPGCLVLELEVWARAGKRVSLT